MFQSPACSNESVFHAQRQGDKKKEQEKEKRNNAKRRQGRGRAREARCASELLINFRERIYSGNGRLLQGDIYRSWVDGRAAWREIKSDCLGKSEPPLPSEPRTTTTTPWCPSRATFFPVAVLHTSHETKNTKNIRIGALADLCRPRGSLFHGSVSEGGGGGGGRGERNRIASILPNSDKPAQCVIRPWK